MSRRIRWRTISEFPHRTCWAAPACPNGVLTLLAEAPDAESLERVQHVLGSHLERFGQRNELAVTWTTRA